MAASSWHLPALSPAIATGSLFTRGSGPDVQCIACTFEPRSPLSIDPSPSAATAQLAGSWLRVLNHRNRLHLFAWDETHHFVVSIDIQGI